MDKICTTIRICGYEYTITGEDSLSRVEKVRDYVQGNINKLSSARLSDEQRAVLTALRAADDLMAAREAKGITSAPAVDSNEADKLKAELDAANKRALEAERQIKAGAGELKMVREELARAREEAQKYAQASSDAHGELTKAWEVHGELSKVKKDLSLAKGETLRQTAAAKEHSDRADTLAARLAQADERADAAEKELIAVKGKLDEAVAKAREESQKAEDALSQMGELQASLDASREEAKKLSRDIVKLKEQIRTLDAQKRRMEWARK